MSYLIRYCDEYGVDNYFCNPNLVEFETMEKAEEQLDTLMEDELQTFGTVLTAYRIVSIDETVEKVMDYCTKDIDKDEHTIVFSASAGKKDYLMDMVNDLRKAGCNMIKKKEYKNGAIIIELECHDKKLLNKLDVNAKVRVKDDRIVLTYTEDEYLKYQTAISAFLMSEKDSIQHVVSSFDLEWTTVFTFKPNANISDYERIFKEVLKEE